MQRRPRRRQAHRAGGLASGQLRLYLTVAGIIIALVLLILLLRPASQLLNAPEIARAKRLGVLRVGVLADMPGFSVVKNGSGEGLEVSLAHALAKQIFPDMDPQVSAELVAVNRYTAISHLKKGDVDVVFAMQRNTGSDLYTYSAPYFTDSVQLLCRAGTEHDALKAKSIGMIENSESAAAWKIYDQKNDAMLKAQYYASYPDLVSALRAGKVDYVAVPGAVVSSLLTSGITVHDTSLGPAEYVAVSMAESPSFALLADLVIQQMQGDGELNALISQYGLTQYTAEK